jgi:hypothetical protein
MLVGAWAVGPLAGEWIHYAALAIKIETPLRGLHDTVAQFRTFTEAYLKGWSPLRSRPRVDPRRPRKEEAHAADG